MNFFNPVFIFSALCGGLLGCNAPNTHDFGKTKMVVRIHKTPVLQTPNLNSLVLSLLNQGDSVRYGDKLSHNTSKRVVYGVSLQEPWLWVETAKGVRGWIYAPSLAFDPIYEPLLVRKILKPRFDFFFGKRLGERVAHFNQRFDRANTQEELAAVYREGKGLRDSLQGVLSRRIAADTVLLDMFWLRGMIRGMSLCLADDRMHYNMAYDFSAWRRRALSTRGNADDDFMSLIAQAYNEGVETRIAVWQQCDTPECTEPYSRLGSGTHLRLLTALNKALAQSKCFESEILAFKTLLMNDMTENTTFAQPTEAVQAEISSILNTPLFNIFQEADRIVLDTYLHKINTENKPNLKAFIAKNKNLMYKLRNK